MKLYNTPHKQVEDVTAREGDELSVYTCGPTVYDYPHIGNWFTFVRYDLLIRALKISGFRPNWVMNITDVGHLVSDADEGEDKLEKGARREGKTAWEIADFYTQNFMEGLRKLNILEPGSLPRATEHINEQIELVKNLEQKGFTYQTDDGVYFDTSKFPGYADFAGLNLRGQEAGARVAINAQKRNQTDFALWKFSPKGVKRDMEWDSPWGKGFPGWHLECSAMSMKYLGETLDLHAGGIDHIPVHHTNEIAQSEAATGLPYTRFWMHTNHITVDGAKIAKSAGNSITLEDIAAKGIPPMSLRMLILESHYRTQSVFSWETLAAADQRLRSLQAFADLVHQPQTTELPAGQQVFEEAEKSIQQALTNDLNSPEALKILSEITADVEAAALHKDDVPAMKSFLHFLDEALGFDLAGRPDLTDQQKSTLSEREQARQTQDWARSDELRDKLATQDIGINDTAHGQLWYRLKS